jgi:hypothetical protein
MLCTRRVQGTANWPNKCPLCHIEALQCVCERYMRDSQQLPLGQLDAGQWGSTSGDQSASASLVATLETADVGHAPLFSQTASLRVRKANRIQPTIHASNVRSARPLMYRFEPLSLLIVFVQKLIVRSRRRQAPTTGASPLSPLPCSTKSSSRFPDTPQPFSMSSQVPRT